MDSERSAPSQINGLDARTMPRVRPISGVTLFRHQIVVTLASWCPLSSWSGGPRSVDTLVPERCPGGAGCLIGHGGQDGVCRPPRQEPVAPAGARARLGTTLPRHPFCRLQHFLSPASAPQTTEVQRTSNHIVRCLATLEQGGLNLDPNRPSCEILRSMRQCRSVP